MKGYVYRFDSSGQLCKNINGKIVELKGLQTLVKVKKFSLFHSWYYVVNLHEIVDCSGYIEERCLSVIDMSR